MNKNIYDKGRPGFNLPSLPHMVTHNSPKWPPYLEYFVIIALYYDVNKPKNKKFGSSQKQQYTTINEIMFCYLDHHLSILQMELLLYNFFILFIVSQINNHSSIFIQYV